MSKEEIKQTYIYKKAFREGRSEAFVICNDQTSDLQDYYRPRTDEALANLKKEIALTDDLTSKRIILLGIIKAVEVCLSDEKEYQDDCLEENRKKIIKTKLSKSEEEETKEKPTLTQEV